MAEQERRGAHADVFHQISEAPIDEDHISPVAKAQYPGSRDRISHEGRACPQKPAENPCVRRGNGTQLDRIPSKFALERGVDECQGLQCATRPSVTMRITSEGDPIL